MRRGAEAGNAEPDVPGRARERRESLQDMVDFYFDVEIKHSVCLLAISMLTYSKLFILPRTRLAPRRGSRARSRGTRGARSGRRRRRRRPPEGGPRGRRRRRPVAGPCYGILYCIVLYCIVLYCIVLYCIVLCYITLYYITLHYIALHYIMLYCIIYYIVFNILC